MPSAEARSILFCLSLALVALTMATRTPSQQSANERPFLWRIEAKTEDGAPSWLFGTSAVPDERVLRMPDAVQQAFAGADAFYGDLRMDPQRLQAVQRLVTLPGERRLQDLLPDAACLKVRALVQQSGVPFEAVERQKPWALATQLWFLERMDEFAECEAMTERLYAQAAEAEKEIGELDTIEEQFAGIESFDLRDQTLMLTRAVDQIVQYREAGEDLLEIVIQAYLRGSGEELHQAFELQVDDHPDLTARLLDVQIWQRNDRMTRKIVAELGKHPRKSCFFALDAGQFVTDRGVQNQLRRAGFEVVRIGADGDVVPEMDAVELRAALRRLDRELGRLEQSLSGLERKLEEQPDRQAEIRAEFDVVHAKFDAVRSELQQKIDAMRALRRKSD